MINIANILNGWKNYVFKNKDIEELAKQRAVICANCDFSKKGSYQQLMPDYSLKNVKGYKCNKCGCPLSAKLRSEKETCPINKW